MTDSPVLPPRPDPPRRPGESARVWVAWLGPSRLVMSAVSMVVVGLGVLWLVRTPAPPTEADLPFTTGTVASSAVVEPSDTAAPARSAPSTSLPAGVVVHVAGSVVRPGVYELDGDARVDIAIAAAGGPVAVADLDGLNLAAVVVDGQRIYVPAEGEVDPAAVPSGGTTTGTAAATGAAPGPIDLNVASVVELETLPGVGPATASAIVDDRDRHGPFASVADLERVPGIGPAKLAAVADLVTV